MDSRQDRIVDAVFREGLEQGRERPSTDLWDRIEEELEGEESPKAVIPIWKIWSVAATVALLIALGYIGYLSMDEPTVDAGLAQQEQASDGDQINKHLKQSRQSVAMDDAQDAATNGQTTSSENPLLNRAANELALDEGRANAEDGTAAAIAPTNASNTTKSTRRRSDSGQGDLANAATSSAVQTAGNGTGNKSSQLNAATGGAASDATNDSFDQTGGGTVAGAAMADQTRNDITNPTIQRMDLRGAALPTETYSLAIATRPGSEHPDLKDLFEGEDWETGEESDRGALAWSMGGFFGPGTATAAAAGPATELSASTPDQLGTPGLDSESATNSSDETEVNFAYSTGIQFGLGFGKRFSLQSGLNFGSFSGDRIEYQTRSQLVGYESSDGGVQLIDPYSNPQNPTTIEDFLGSPGVTSNRVYAARTDTVRTGFSYRFLEVPLMLRYNFINRRFKYYLASGFSANLLSRYSEDVEGSLPVTRFAPSQLNFLVSTGVEYELFRSVNLRVEPLARFGVWSREESLSNRTFNTFGLNTGLTIHF